MLMDTCVNLSAMDSYQSALNALSHQYTNWTFNKIPLRWMISKQCHASDSNEIVSESTISQTTLFLANTQYIFSMAVIMVILLVFRRATTSITKDDSLAYLCKDLIAIIKLLHWNSCDYSSIAFTTSCFVIFMAMLPLLLTLWLCMLCYRQTVHWAIKVSVCVCVIWKYILLLLLWLLLLLLLHTYHFQIPILHFHFRENMAINFVDF